MNVIIVAQVLLIIQAALNLLLVWALIRHSRIIRTIIEIGLTPIMEYNKALRDLVDARKADNGKPSKNS